MGPNYPTWQNNEKQSRVLCINREVTHGRRIQVTHASAIEAMVRKQLSSTTLIMQGVRK